MARIAQILCCVSVMNNTCKYYEYVTSEANVSDLPSRPPPCISSPPTAEEEAAYKKWASKHKAEWDRYMPSMVQVEDKDIVYITEAQWDDPASLLPARMVLERETKAWDRRQALAKKQAKAEEKRKR
jgi:hypothetical protein